MSKHLKNTGRFFKKRGMTVDVSTSKDENGVVRSNIEQAIRTLKRRMTQEGVIRDLRKNEYFESKGAKRRRRKEESIRRQKKENEKRTP